MRRWPGCQCVILGRLVGDGLVGDVLAAPGSWPADGFDRAVSLLLGLADRVSHGGYTQYATTLRDGHFVLQLRARMKYLDVR